MNWTIPSRTLIKNAGKLAAAFVLYACLRQVGFYNLTAREAEGLGVLIQLVGDIYAVLLAFMIFVIWGQFTDVENCVIRECDSVDDLLRFSAYLNAEAAATIRRAITAYTRQVLNSEWLALGDGQKDDQAEKLFLRVVNSVIEATPQKEAEQMMRLRLIDMVQRTSQCRDERVAKSLTRIPPTLAGLVNLIAGVLLLLIFVYPFHHWVAGVSCFVLVAVVLFLANFVLMDTDNPLKGTWNVSPEPFGRFH
jgi:hypothetical protein